MDNVNSAKIGEGVYEDIVEYVNSVLCRIDKSGERVYVHASSLGSVRALIDKVKVPVRGMSIGAVEKKDVMEASVMLGKRYEYATILALGVEVTPEASQLAHQLGVKIFTSDITHLLAHMDRFKAEAQVFPCVLKIMRVFNTKDPIVLDVHVVEGIAKILGSNPEERQKMIGRHFGMEDELVSKITSDSLDALRKQYMGDLSTEDNVLLYKLKQLDKMRVRIEGLGPFAGSLHPSSNPQLGFERRE